MVDPCWFNPSHWPYWLTAEESVGVATTELEVEVASTEVVTGEDTNTWISVKMRILHHIIFRTIIPGTFAFSEALHQVLLVFFKNASNVLCYFTIPNELGDLHSCKGRGLKASVCGRYKNQLVGFLWTIMNHTYPSRNPTSLFHPSVELSTSNFGWYWFLVFHCFIVETSATLTYHHGLLLIPSSLAICVPINNVDRCNGPGLHRLSNSYKLM